MKSKKLLGFISAIMGLFLTVTSLTGLTAFADGTGIGAYQVKAGSVKECVFVHNSLADYFVAAEGETVDVKKIDSISVTHATEGALTDGTHYDFNKSKGTILFGLTGKHDVTVTFKDGETTNVLTKEDILVVTKDDADPVKYQINETKIAEFNDLLKTKVTELGEDATSLTIPDAIWDYVYSNVLSKEHFRSKVYVQTPGTESATFSVVSSSWSSSLSKISLSNKGTYYFYVEVIDAFDNKIVKDSEYKLKENGWYKLTQADDPATEDVDESKYNELVIPVFSFTYDRYPVHKVELTSKVTEGIVGQEFTYVKATLTSSIDQDVKLYYNPNATDKKPNEEGASGWVEAVNGEDAEYNALTASSMRFTPLKKGSYCVFIESVGGEEGFDKKQEYSPIILVSREIQQQKLVNDGFAKFLKNNWLSVVFLGIALLCIVGIVILAFYNPKDETPAPKKKEKVEDAEDVKEEEVVDATEDVEDEEEVVDVTETEEEPEAETENVEENPAEEPTTEEAVEEVPAEETPATEEKAEGENA